MVMHFAAVTGSRERSMAKARDVAGLPCLLETATPSAALTALHPYEERAASDREAKLNPELGRGR